MGTEVIYRGDRSMPDGGRKAIKKGPRWLFPDESLKLRNHSPDGFNWGYGGSGPAQLALALLLDATDDSDVALKYYQDFKWDVVAEWKDTWSISGKEICAWLCNWTVTQ